MATGSLCVLLSVVVSDEVPSELDDSSYDDVVRRNELGTIWPRGGEVTIAVVTFEPGEADTAEANAGRRTEEEGAERAGGDCRGELRSSGARTDSSSCAWLEIPALAICVTCSTCEDANVSSSSGHTSPAANELTSRLWPPPGGADGIGHDTP